MIQGGEGRRGGTAANAEEGHRKRRRGGTTAGRKKSPDSARIKSIVVRGTTSFAPVASTSRISPLSLPVSRCPFPAGAVVAYRSFSLPRGRIGARTPFFIIGVDHRLLFYNNCRARVVVASLSLSLSLSLSALNDLLLQC